MAWLEPGDSQLHSPILVTVAAVTNYSPALWSLQPTVSCQIHLSKTTMPVLNTFHGMPEAAQISRGETVKVYGVGLGRPFRLFSDRHTIEATLSALRNAKSRSSFSGGPRHPSFISPHADPGRGLIPRMSHGLPRLLQESSWKVGLCPFLDIASIQ